MSFATNYREIRVRVGTVPVFAAVVELVSSGAEVRGINISDTDPGKESLLALARAVRDSGSVQSFCMDDVRCENAFVIERALAILFENHSCLKNVSASNVGPFADPAASFVPALAANSVLRILALRENQLGNSGVAAISHAIERSSSLAFSHTHTIRGSAGEFVGERDQLRRGGDFCQGNG